MNSTELLCRRGHNTRLNRVRPAMRFLRVLCLATLPSIAGSCAGRVVVSSPALPHRERPTLGNEQYRSTIAAQVTGRGVISGTVEGDAYEESNSSAADRPLSLAKAVEGNEYDHPGQCRSTQRVLSQARSSARVTPQSNASLRSFGFAVDVSVRAQNGMWREHGVLPAVCTGTNYTRGTASASATGEIRFTYAPLPGETADDQLIVFIGGGHPRQLRLTATGPGGNASLQRISPETYLVEAARPGTYIIRGTLSTRVAPDGRSANVLAQSLNAAVSVQSKRDQLNLGYGERGVLGGRIDLPVTVSTEALLRVVRDSLFGSDGQFYPCRDRGETCEHRRLYLRNPQIRTEGAWLVVQAELDGNANVGGILSPGVTGHVQLGVIPIVTDSILHLTEGQLTVESRNALVRVAAQAVGRSAVTKVQERVRVNLGPLMRTAMQSIASRFPIALDPNKRTCITLNLDRLRLRGIEMNSTGEMAIVMHFTALTGVGVGTQCQNAHVPKGG